MGGLRLSLLVFSGALLMACTASVPLTPTATPSPSPTATAPPTVAPTPPPATSATLPSIAEVVERVSPAVVAITVEVLAPGFFGSARRSASGSGVIFDERGYALTNNHVVEGARSIRVDLADQRTLEATLVGRDPLTDLAVIDIEGEGFPTVPLGDSEALRIGDWVIAIGNALDLEGGPTVTLGVVGAKGRSLTTEGDVTLHDLIQTDAAINPGNSGGPLVNLRGEVVGINTAIIQGATGIGFAISTWTAAPVAQQLVQNGSVIWPWLGVTVRELTPQVALEEGIPVRRGVLLVNVVSGGPAARAGLAPDDVIVRMNEAPITSTKELQRATRGRRVGETVQVTVVRAGRERTLGVTLGEMPRL